MYIDGTLVESARDGHREAVAAVCQFAAIACAKQWKATDGALRAYLIHALSEIGNGKAPNEAFGFALARGRPKAHPRLTSENVFELAKQSRSKEAVEMACRLAAESINTETGFSDGALKAYLATSLSKVGTGAQPDHAFGFNAGRRGNTEKHDAFRNWEIQTEIQKLMRTGATLNAAIEAIASDFEGPSRFGKSNLELICAGLTADTPLPLPDDVFPVSIGTPPILGTQEAAPRPMGRRKKSGK